MNRHFLLGLLSLHYIQLSTAQCYRYDYCHHPCDCYYCQKHCQGCYVANVQHGGGAGARLTPSSGTVAHSGTVTLSCDGLGVLDGSDTIATCTGGAWDKTLSGCTSCDVANVQHGGGAGLRLCPSSGTVINTGTVTLSCDTPNVLTGTETIATCSEGTWDNILSGCTPPGVLNVNEFHYDNTGGDTGEFIELIYTGTDTTTFNVTGWKVVLYNGNGGALYDTLTLSGQTNNSLIAVDAVGLQNGSPDGIAVVDNSVAGVSVVVQFISYEGSFVATNGPAAGMTSTDVGVSEPSNTPVGKSLQLCSGAWNGTNNATRGLPNACDP